MEGVLSKLNDFVAKMNFGANARIRFYEALILMLQNNVQLNEALAELYLVASQHGRKPTHPLAQIYQHCTACLAGGGSLSDALEIWVNPTELALLRAGERSGELVRAMHYTVNLIQRKKAMQGALFSATAYPTVLFALAGFLMNMIATQLVPKLARVAPPDTWEGPARGLYLVADFTTRFGVAAVSSLAVTLVLCLISLPYLRGPLRVRLDRFFPWSVYRILYGSSFLLGVALMVGSGQQLRESLGELARGANPWLRERIEGAQAGLDSGLNFGVALEVAGHEFPDRVAVQYLTIFANRNGFEQSIVNYAERWMEQSVATMKRMAGAFLAVGLAVIALLMLLVIGGSSGISDAVQSRAGV